LQSYAYKYLNRDIVNIRYYLLNLPDTIQFGTGNQIINKYAANGQKLSTEYYTKISPLLQPLVTGEVYNWKANPGEMEKTSTLYIGNIEYETSRYDWNTLLLNRISNHEGYVDNFNVSMQDVRYNYFRRDHLGNNREVWYASYNKWERNADQMGYHTVGIPAATSQQTQYYPSGLPWAEGMGQDVQTRKYNGKEFVEMHGYDSYDFGHRGFYPAADVFTTIDWKAEETPEQSPYCYAFNNPVRYRDENGDDGWDVVEGIVNAVSDDATIGITNRSSNANYDDAGDYNTGQTIGHLVGFVLGGLETISGGGTAVGGSIVAVAGSETIIAIPAGTAIAIKGGAMMALGTMMMAKATDGLKKQKGNVNESNKNGSNIDNSSKSKNKGTLSGTKKAVKKAQDKVGGPLSKGKLGKKGSPQRGDSEKGYRLDPGHPNRPTGDPEGGPHVNWWDYTKSKRKSGGEVSGAFRID